jgi:hypothetical protein
MVRRSRHADLPQSSVVALWKDRTGGVVEITLDPDAHAILLTANCHNTLRRAADGRSPEPTSADLDLARTTQIRATDAAKRRAAAPGSTGQPALTSSELSVFLAWSDAVTDAVAIPTDHLDTLVDDLRPDADWRVRLNLPRPQGALGRALEALANNVLDGRLGGQLCLFPACKAPDG